MKWGFDKNSKDDNFRVLDKVLRWDARIEDKGKHYIFGYI